MSVSSCSFAVGQQQLKIDSLKGVSFWQFIALSQPLEVPKKYVTLQIETEVKRCLSPHLPLSQLDTMKVNKVPMAFHWQLEPYT